MHNIPVSRLLLYILAKECMWEQRQALDITHNHELLIHIGFHHHLVIVGGEMVEGMSGDAYEWQPNLVSIIIVGIVLLGDIPADNLVDIVDKILFYLDCLLC